MLEESVMSRLLWPLAMLALFATSCTTRNPTRDQSVQKDSFVQQDTGPLFDHGLPPEQGLPPDYGTPPPPDQWVPPVDKGTPPPPDQWVPPVDRGTPPPPDLGISNALCKGAKRLVWSGSRAQVTATTSGMANEYGTGINCGNLTMTVPGSQVYYSIDLTGGKNYRFRLKPAFYSARMYIFTGCGISTINKDCGSNGTTGDISEAVSSPNTGTVFFTPPKTGTYLVAVDSNTPSQSGAFTLTVDAYTKPSNNTCSKAKLLKLGSTGTVTEVGSTVGLQNEFGGQINCGYSGYSYYGLPAPQLYYQIAMTAGRTYRISLTPNSGYLMFYVFGTTCTASAINSDCGSGGTSGAVYTSTITSGRTGSMNFKPSKTGYYTIAVDGRYNSAYYQGDFTLEVEDYTPPANGKCATAQSLSLSSGKVTVNGSTSGIANEFGSQITCGLASYYAQDGSQVYYKLSLTAGKVYKFELRPTFYAYMYIFGSTCTATAINNDCGSGGKTGAITASYVSSGSAGSIIFKPSATGTYTVAVDSFNSGSYYEGKFQLNIEETLAANNGKCNSASSLTFVSGKAVVTGDTTGIPNEFGSGVRCGSYTMSGSQLYYWANLAKGTTYKFTLTPSFYAQLYVFGNTCTASTISSNCSSGGSTGFYNYCYTSACTATYTPTVGGIHRIAVDSSYASYAGSFKLEVETFTPPKNGKCAGAQTLTFDSSGKAVVNGDTTGVPNEFGTQINCGTTIPTIGNQQYYRIRLTKGTTYSITLEPQVNYLGFIVFTDTCTPSTINSDCGSGGKTGLISAAAYPSRPATSSFTPPTTAYYKIAVDTTYTQYFGPYKLTIK
jgi:hypothetical protein